MSVVSPSCYELLGVPVDAPRDAIGRALGSRRTEAFRRLAEGDVDRAEALMSRLDEAFNILSDMATARRYRLYRAQLSAGRRIVHPEDFSTLAPDEVATDSGVDVRPYELAGGSLVDDSDDVDAVTTLDEWDVDGIFDAEDDQESQTTEALGKAFAGSLGLLAQVVLATPAPEESPRPAPEPPKRRHIVPPWFALDPPEPESMEPPVHASSPGGALPVSQPGHSLVSPARLDTPPWED